MIDEEEARAQADEDAEIIIALAGRISELRKENDELREKAEKCDRLENLIIEQEHFLNDLNQKLESVEKWVETLKEAPKRTMMQTEKIASILEKFLEAEP